MLPLFQKQGMNLVESVLLQLGVVEIKIPIDLLIEVPIDTEVPIAEEVPVKLAFPVTVPMDELGFNLLLVQVKDGLRLLAELLGAPVEITN